MDLQVTDPAETRRLRERAAQNMPAFFRFYPNAAREAEAEFHAAFSREHAKFMALVERGYRRSKLNQATVNHASFGQFLAWVQKQNPSFPGATNLGRLWALGEPAESVREELVLKLRQVMKHFIRSDALPVDQEGKTKGVKVFPAKYAEVIPDLAVVEKRSQEVPPDEFYSLAEARRELSKSFPSAEQPLAKFLAEFLKENCVFDPQLTERMEKKKAAGIWALAHYEVGQLIVQSGQTIDAKAKAALERLEEKRTVEQKKAAATREREQKLLAARDWFDQSLGVVFVKWEHAEPIHYALGAALVGLLLVLILLRRERKKGRAPRPAPVPVSSQPMAYTVILNPERNETIFLPVKNSASPPIASIPPPAEPAPMAPAPAPLAETLNDAKWQERAREAEKRAEELLAMVRQGLAPHLAKELMNRLVQEMIAQRSSLLQTQQIATREVASIEARFTAIYQQLQEQLKAYEQRTQHLEEKLANKDEENSELLKAMITTQKKLQSTRSGNSGV